MQQAGSTTQIFQFSSTIQRVICRTMQIDYTHQFERILMGIFIHMPSEDRNPFEAPPEPDFCG